MRKIICSFVFMFMAASAYAQSTYLLSPNSKLTISGTSTVHDWTVTANSIDGSLMAEDSAPTAIDFQVDVAQIISERGATMDKKMHTALQKEKHPKINFEFIELKGESTVLGTLTIAGITQSVEIESKIVPSKNAINFFGEHKMALKEFDIEPPTAMFGTVVVGEDVTVHFDLIFEGDE